MPGKSKGAKSDSSRKVWHFVRYQERFGVKTKKSEQPGPPQFLAYVVNAWTGPRGEVQQAMQLIRREKDFVLLLGGMYELLSWASNTEERFQGYLLSTDRRAATERTMAGWLGVKSRDIGRILKVLTAVGVLERLDLPDFGDSPEKKSPGRARARARTTKRAARTTAPPARKRAPRKKNQTLADPAGAIENADFVDQDGDPLKRKEKCKCKLELEGKEKITSRQERDHRSCARTISESESPDQAEGTTPRLAQSEPPPTTTPVMPTPTMPTTADAGGPRLKLVHSAPQASLPSTRGYSGPQWLAMLLQQNNGRYSRRAVEMAARILDALAYKPPNPSEMAREVGCFAKAYQQVLDAGHPDHAMTWFDAELLKRAARIRKRPRANRQSYMRTTVTNLAIDLHRKFHRSRASPSAG